MKAHFIFIVTVLLFSNPSFAQQEEQESGNDSRGKTSSMTISPRIFTYDAAGNRILMSTPAREEQQSPNKNQTHGGQICLSVTSGILKVCLSEEINEPYGISVYNIAGQLMAELKDCRGMSQNINLSNLERGVYVIDVSAGNNHSTRKITKE